MDLLVLLASRPGEVVTHEEIFAALWPGVVVGDDTLARCVSKLRKGLEDDPKAPVYVETIPKRGYRLIAEVGPPAAEPARAPPRWEWIGVGVAVLAVAVALIFWPLLQGSDGSTALLARAQDAYFQYTRADNESAIALYERVLVDDPDSAAAQAGLARALVQRVLRWPNAPGEEEFTRTTLGEAIASGRTRTASAQATLQRARTLAESAVRRRANDSIAQQALGLTLAAQGEFDAAQAAYERALASDANAWGALVNLGDLEDIRGAPERALPFYERAYEVMERVYEREPQRIGPWHAEVGVLVAERHFAAGRSEQAEAWYRKVLAQAPMNPAAVTGLAQVFEARGEIAAAREICAGLAERTGASAGCVVILER